MNKNIAVFCGSNTGHSSVFAQVAKDVGRSLANEGWGIVYGGAKVGLMGALADGALSVGGKVIGVAPHKLIKKEITHDQLSELLTTQTMAERKNMMLEKSHAFLALPGGFGTLDEIFEAITLAQIGVHQKPSVFLNVSGYFDHLKIFLQHSVDNGFISAEHFSAIPFLDSVAETIKYFRSHDLVDIAKHF